MAAVAVAEPKDIDMHPVEEEGVEQDDLYTKMKDRQR